jgi:RNA ligase (TIGR02306 family)
MIRKLASIQKIDDLQPIKDSDRIEKVRIKGWWVVVPKDEFRVGDLCVYFEIDSFLPVTPWSEFLLKGSSPKKIIVEGKGEVEGIRLKTIKLRGQISQGLALPLSIIEDRSKYTLEVNTDVTDILKVFKYEIPIPVHLSGSVKGSFPGFITKTDEERIQNLPEYLVEFSNQTFTITEKLDGTSSTIFKYETKQGVCSRNLELKEDNNNLYWRMAKPILEVLPDNWAIQGEIVGEGIQKNKLKLKGQHFYAFYIQDLKENKYLPYEDFIEWCSKNGVKTVPIIEKSFKLLGAMDDIIKMAEGVSLLTPQVQREGLVFQLSNSSDKVSFKVISNKYLLKND